MKELDAPSPLALLQQLLASKPALRLLYQEAYLRYADCLSRCPPSGLALEIGAGAGFAKEILPQLITSDLVAYKHLDVIMEAARMPFRSGSLRMICMLNVFHHISDPESFLREVHRCLRPSGRVFIVDQYPGWPARLIYRWGHHETFNTKAANWHFAGQRPLLDANGALAWIVFERDKPRFEALFPDLQLALYRPHTPLRYWLAGGLKSWSLIPRQAFDIVSRLDRRLIALSSRFASFVDIEIVRR